MRLFIKKLELSLENLQEYSKFYDILMFNSREEYKKYELTEINYKFKQQVTRLTGETDDNLELIQGLEDNIKNRDNRILKKFRIIETNLDSIKAMLNGLKDSKINKFW